MKLKDLKRQIYKEFDLDDELLLIYGNQQDLEDVRQLVFNQKQKLTMKSLQILDT